MDPSKVADQIRILNDNVIDEMNAFCAARFQTRGGRKGSGMGLLLEGLWGYEMTRALEGLSLEIAWIADDAYNDYACVRSDVEWNPLTEQGELFRIEAKSMNLGADESKAHFDELTSRIAENDLLLILTWTWVSVAGGSRVCPKISKVYLERAKPLAELRDHLHVLRGGTFVDARLCPDGCSPDACSHAGEPLNAKGKRERDKGPISRKPHSVSFAANFGGLFRMIGAKTNAQKKERDAYAASRPEAKRYIDFINESRKGKV